MAQLSILCLVATLRIPNSAYTAQGSPSLTVSKSIQKLRKLGLGCYMGGLWIGTCGFADDLLLLAPGRKGMEKMLEVFNSPQIQILQNPSPNVSL